MVERRFDYEFGQEADSTAQFLQSPLKSQRRQFGLCMVRPRKLFSDLLPAVRS